jgi:prepilin signal peptidase PulO-like enzyme (type II secretory pathway)
MIIAILAIAGLCLGSFVNALIWRLHGQTIENSKTKPNKRYIAQLSVLKGRSMCPRCKHQLSTRDLIPVVSWLSLKGSCRYCGKPISPQYPLVELATALLFIASYLWWPVALNGAQISIFVIWLVLLVGFVALIVYDLRWQLLPNRILYPLGAVAVAMAAIKVATAAGPAIALLNLILAVVVGGGIFYVLFQVSSGKWIGGGDVKLGWLLGLVAGTPARSLLLIFLAALIGSLCSLPLLLTKRLKRTSTIPFGPFLILAIIIVQLFGASILVWYRQTFIKL